MPWRPGVRRWIWQWFPDRCCSRFRIRWLWPTADNVRALVADVVQVDNAPLRMFFTGSFGAFFDRFRLARQRSLADEEILCLDDPYVGRDHVARGKHYDVSRDELLDGNLCNILLAASYRAGVFDHFLQSSARQAGFPVLPKPDDCAEQDHRRYDDDRGPILLVGCGHPYVEDVGDDDQCGQDPDERIDERLDEHRYGIFPFFVFDFVFSVIRLSPFGLFGG